MADAALRIPDSHKNAFWIYGVTAMILREPLSIVTRDLSAKGLGDASVRVECLRMLVVLLVLSRQFLSAGVYFDRVYLQPDSAAKYPHKSYPVDFLTRLVDLLAAVAASTAVGLHTFPLWGLAPFLAVIVLLLLFDALWAFTARTAGYSTVSELAPTARGSLLVLLVCFILYIGAGLAALPAEMLDAGLLMVVLISTSIQLAGLIRSYGRA
ncbi:MAG: hypothetical protein ABL995_18820 [Bryobacteraceae bacterium]